MQEIKEEVKQEKGDVNMGERETSVWTDDFGRGTASQAEEKLAGHGDRRTEDRQYTNAVQNGNPGQGTGTAQNGNPGQGAGTAQNGNPGQGAGTAQDGNLGQEAGTAQNGNSGQGTGAVKSGSPGQYTGSLQNITPGQGTAAQPVPPYTVIQGPPVVPDTEETKRLRENFGLIAPAAFIYAVFYAFCMYKNGSGITFPFFVGGSLIFLRFSSSKLGVTFKKGSVFYMAAMLLLGISTFCTDDARIIFFNKLGVLLLTMSLLLKQYFDTAKWKLGKYLGSIIILVFASFGELGRPFSDGAAYVKSRKNKPDTRIWYAALGLLAGIPLFFVVLLLLASADAIFGQMANDMLCAVNLELISNVLLRIVFLFFASYALTAYLCRKKIREEVPDRRRGEPVLAITVTGLLTALYLLFSAVQIGGLFLGRMQLPRGYTYAMYAREGFFQLLAVSLLNLVIVLAVLNYFRESKMLKGILTLMSFCTFIMIASSAMRMIIYIRYYYLTFLRILVLWGLALLAVLFLGVVIHIFKENFPLFRYGMAAVAVMYLALSFAHPDYIIARVNIANAPTTITERTAAEDTVSGDTRSDVWNGGFFLASAPYQDYRYLANLSADAAPALVPYLETLGYHMEAFQEDSPIMYAVEQGVLEAESRDMYFRQESFGYCWMLWQKESLENMGPRTFNLSRYLAWKLLNK